MGLEGESLSWWQQTTTVPPPPPVDGLPRSVPVAIVGGGMMGASLAWWLTSHGLKPLVLERRRPAFAASGRNGGLVVVGGPDEYVELAAQFGPATALEVIRATRENHALLEAFLEERGLLSAWARAGFLSLFSSEAEAQPLVDSAPMMNGLGWETQLLDRAGCEQVLGTRLSRRLLGGAWTPGDGVVQPVTYVNALAQAAHQNGARFAYPVEVLAVRRLGEAWEVGTSRGSLLAEHVVLAANQRTETLLPECAPFFRYPRDTVVVTEPAQRPIRAGWAEGSIAPYGRPLSDGRLLFGGFARLGRVAVTSEDHSVEPAAVQRELRAYLASTFPELRHLRLAHAWTGTLASTRDRFPLVGPWRPGERLWLLTGFGGDGLPWSQWAPKVLASAIAGPGSVALPSYLAPSRFIP